MSRKTLDKVRRDAVLSTKRSRRVVLAVVFCLVSLSPGDSSFQRWRLRASVPTLLASNGEGEKVEPSHVMMCRAILDRSHGMEQLGASATAHTPLAVYESGSNCLNTYAPYASILSVFISALLGETIGRDLGISYVDACRPEGGTFLDRLVGNGLRGSTPLPRQDPLAKLILEADSVRAAASELGNDQLLEFCSQTVSLYDSSRGQGYGEILVREWGAPLIRSIIPLIQLSMLQLASVLKYRPSATAQEKSALIYLSNEGQHNQHYASPLYIYVSDIPRSTSRIDIVGSPSCQASLACETHGKTLRDALAQFYPRATVGYEVVSSTAVAYTKMVEATTLVCPPPGVGCLLPSLAKTEAKHAVLVENSRLYPWLTLDTLGSLPLLSNAKLLPQDSVPSQDIMSVGTLTGTRDILGATLWSAPPPGSPACNVLRGRVGMWVPDNHYAAAIRYLPISPGYGKAESEYVPTTEQPYRLETTQKWVETAYPTCEQQLMTRDGFCFVMKRLGMERIFFLGDSLTFQMYNSFWGLTGMSRSQPEFPDASNQWSWTNEMPCSDGYSITINFVRSDDLSRDDVALPALKKEWVGSAKKARNIKQYEPNFGTDYCWPWSHIYKKKHKRTVLVANMGSHVMKHQDFNKGFDKFVDLVDAVVNADDLVLYRTTVPGHMGCTEADALLPHESYDEYLNVARQNADPYSWRNFIDYNDYADQVLEDRRWRKPRASGMVARIDMLDVYPMTVLRRDGHQGHQTPSKVDCLHYSLPGPVDWWNHMMFSHLAGMLEATPNNPIL